MNIGNWLKKYFIPHKTNEHKPHFLRNENAILILAAVLFIEALFLIHPVFFQKTDLFASILQNILISETNNSRQSENLSILQENPLLDVAAKMKAEDMAINSYFAHTSPNGLEPWYWLEKVGYEYVYAGENLAINFSDSEDVIKAWMNSPTHRQNILGQNFTEMGIATAKGIYKEKETTFIVQMFGNPVKSATAENLKQPIAETTSTPTTTNISSVNTGVVLSATTEDLNKTNNTEVLIWKLFASPKTTSFYLLSALIIIVSIALLLNIAIKPKIQHPKLILNGIALLLIMNAALIFNNYFSFTKGLIF